MRFLGLTGIVLLVAALLVWLTSSPDFSNTSDTLGNAATGNPVAFDRASEKSVPTTRQGSDSQRSQIDSAQPQGLADPSSAVTSDNSLPDERNGYLKLIAATEKLYWPEEIKTLLESGAVSLDASPEVFAFLRQLVADNREALALVREALALGVGRIPPVESFNQKLPEIWPLGLLNKILGFEAQIAAHEGNLESALRITGDQGALGKLCMESGGCLVHTLVGNAMTSQGQALRQQLLDAGVIATEDYERFLPLLTGSPLDPRNAYAESLLMESTILS
ncbi:MAG: hypothetical protein Q8P12_06360, partial [bacterium]|nr:hypothetical protein [bacterium]